MLNGKNWWTDPPVVYDYTEDFNKRAEDAAKIVWDDWFGSDLNDGVTGLSHFVDAVKEVIRIMNKPSA
jgi:hypothetical protein